MESRGRMLVKAAFDVIDTKAEKRKHFAETSSSSSFTKDYEQPEKKHKFEKLFQPESCLTTYKHTFEEAITKIQDIRNEENKNNRTVDVNQTSKSEESGNSVTIQSDVLGDNKIRRTPTALCELENSYIKPVNNNSITENCFQNKNNENCELMDLDCMQTNKIVKVQEDLGKCATVKINSESNLPVLAKPGCSTWQSGDRPNEEEPLKLRLIKVKPDVYKTKYNFSGSQSNSSTDVDDTDEDPNFYCSSDDDSNLDSSNNDSFEKRNKKTQNFVNFYKKDQQLKKKIETKPLRQKELTKKKKIPVDKSNGVSDMDSMNNTEVVQEQNEEKNKKSKKVIANPSVWKRCVAKEQRNKGNGYTNNNLKDPKEVRKRDIQPPCSDKCKLKCTTKINNESRKDLFSRFWNLGNLQLQREYISQMMTEVKPQYRYQREGSNRSHNHAFHFIVEGNKIRVCKHFFKSTLDINDRPIRTVISKLKDGFLEEEKRGKHNNHKQVDPNIKDGIREFIRNIPKIESHYLRQQTSREFIEGGKTLIGLYRDYKTACEEKNVPYGQESMFNKLFNFEFNISFFVPKKDQCELCTAYKNAEKENKECLSKLYSVHLEEKELSRIEKTKDKALATDNKNVVVCVYDLQAVLPAPKGDVSVFYYKSKINSYNFTISQLNLQDVQCYFWHEGEGNRGAIEIASCTFDFLKKIAHKNNSENLEVILYSDNCCGQQKNSIVFSMYLYATQILNIKSITHKFLIKGHTQNEGDNIHSVIEKSVQRALKSGPIYTPAEYVRIIRSAKKTGNAYNVNEMSHSDFIDWKQVAKKIGTNFTFGTEVQGSSNQEDLNTQNNCNSKYYRNIKIADIKIINVTKTEPRVVFVKTSYKEENFLKIEVDIAIPKNQIVSENSDKITVKNLNPSRRGRKKSSDKLAVSFKDIVCPPAYSDKLQIGERKKKDIGDLLRSHHIPKFYEGYYNAIFN